MATAKVQETNAELKYSGKCSLCEGNLKTPRLLPCQHSFCTSCLKTHIPETESGTETPNFLCPTCNLEVPLSSGGVEGLPENYLHKIVAKKDFSDTKRECLHCQIQGKTTAADVQCLDCEDAFCNQCQAFHKLSSATRHHRLVLVEDLEASKYKQIQQEKEHFYCEKHSEGARQFLLKTYCRKCRVLHCEECIINNEVHVLQSKDKWEYLHKENLETFGEKVDLLLRNFKQQSNTVEVIKKVEERIHDKKSAIENQICDKATEIQELVEKVKNEKLSVVQKHFEKELQKCQELLQKEVNCLKRFDSTVIFVECFMKHSTEGMYLMHEEDAKTRMANFLVEKEKFRMRTEDFLLKENPVEEMENALSKVLGMFELKYKVIDITGNERAVELKSVVKGKIESDLKAHGIAVAENGDMIVAGGSSIEIFNTDGQSKRVFQCKTLGNAVSVVVKNYLIFITDNGHLARRPTFLVFDMYGTKKISISMPELGTYYPGFELGLAIGKDDTIYTCQSNASAIYTCTLDNTKKKKFISITQQSRLQKQCHLLITPQGHLVVSMGSNNLIQVYNDQASYFGSLKMKVKLLDFVVTKITTYSLAVM